MTWKINQIICRTLAIKTRVLFFRLWLQVHGQITLFTCFFRKYHAKYFSINVLRLFLLWSSSLWSNSSCLIKTNLLKKRKKLQKRKLMVMPLHIGHPLTRCAAFSMWILLMDLLPAITALVQCHRGTVHQSNCSWSMLYQCKLPGWEM